VLPLCSLLAVFSLRALVCADSSSPLVWSPSGRYAAEVWERNCGIATGFNTRVFLRAESNRLPLRHMLEDLRGDGYVFQSRNALREIDLEWLGERTLLITCIDGGYRIGQADEVWGDVEIHYRCAEE
jgi:hypothetical protein